MLYQFGPFRADRGAYRVFEGDRPVDLTPKLLDLLFYLLDRPATLVTKEELLDGVWPGANVTDNALAQAISELREALGDSPTAPRFIRTVARRGYRFVSPVAGNAAASPVASTTTGRGSTARSVAVLDFVNVTGDTDVAWLSAGIAETVTSDLAALGRFRVIDRHRVVHAAHRTGSSSMHEIGAALSVPLIVTGSYQRQGPNLRITARLLDLESGEAVADAKVDGLLQDVFTLQDHIVSGFARELGIPVAAKPARSAARETSSLGAYRAYTEGWLKLETLDASIVPSAMRDFERAIELDTSYALAHTGLATAAFLVYQMTRATRNPDAGTLTAGLEHARRAIRLDPQLADAHATLSLLLVSAGKIEDARASANRAVVLEPDSWRHQYRLAHASWGSARLKAGERTIALYPQFLYAQFEIAMVHVARGQLDAAAEIARHGIAAQDRQAQSANRFPAIGFYWLLGSLALAAGQYDDAIADFDREVEQAGPQRLYGPEYSALALVGRGSAELVLSQPADALASFRRAEAQVPGYHGAQIGMAMALDLLGNQVAAQSARQDAAVYRVARERMGRTADALYAAACEAISVRDDEGALGHLEHLCRLEPPSHYGWTIPIEPFFWPLKDHPRFAKVLSQLVERAR